MYGNGMSCVCSITTYPTASGPVHDGGYSDGVHTHDAWGVTSALTRSEAIKRLKLKMLVRLVDAYQMDQCMIFCRTKVDCDNLEAYLGAVGGGQACTRRAPSCVTDTCCGSS